MTQGATRELARFSHQIALSDVPREVIAKLKMLVIDQLGVEIASMNLPWTQSIKRYAQRYSREGEALVMVSGEALDAEYAVLVNATAGHGFEFDDYHRASTHIGCIAVPTTIAVGLEQRSTGEELLMALLVAFEIQSRVAKATTLSMMVERGFHITGVHGVFGAAIAASRLMKCSEQTTLMALSIAGSHAAGTTEYSQSGGDIKRFHAGIAAAGGIRSARTAACGMTGPSTILEGKRGVLQAFSNHPDPNALVDELGKKWALMETHVKPYAVCALLNGQLDALHSIMRQHQLRSDEIERIIVGGDRFSLVHVGSIGPRPKTVIEAQFSTHYSLAMAAILGANDFAAYLAMAANNFEDAKIAQLAQHIEMVLDPDCDARYPDISKATVTVVTKRGEKLFAEGYCFRVLTEEEVHRKFRKLMAESELSEHTQGIIRVVANLEAIKNVADLTRLLVRSQ